ncbi:VOC family protein [Kribbella sp. NPDC003557]|uniref:VOC family protein n=1 Tax=Kribbella sp. NPDC003557 TaxID=3154449 RepID=UPI0033B2900D
MPEALLDHLVLATPDLEATVAAFADATGVEPVVGGRHVRWGTRNYLAGLGGTAYLEFLGADPEAAPDARSPYPLDRERLVTWAVHPADVDGFVAAAREQGVELGEIVELSRRTAGGAMLRWRLSEVEPAPYGGLVPFVIDWGRGAGAQRGLSWASRRLSMSLSNQKITECRSGVARDGRSTMSNGGRCYRGYFAPTFQPAVVVTAGKGGQAWLRPKRSNKEPFWGSVRRNSPERSS